VDTGELERTFNMGVGMVAIAPQDQVPAAISLLGDRGVPAWACGTVRSRRAGEAGDSPAKGGVGGAVTLVGSYKILG